MVKKKGYADYEKIEAIFRRGLPTTPKAKGGYSFNAGNISSLTKNLIRWLCQMKLQILYSICLKELAFCEENQ